MTSDKLNRFWLAATFLLILIILIGGLIIGSHESKGQPITISPPLTPLFNGEVYIDGAINNPGAYPLKSGDSLESIILASGGINKDADLFHFKLYIPKVNEGQQSQRIDINRAEAWLLQALPNIGEARAQAIVEYRNQNGLFHNIKEIIKVPGISESIYEKIKAFITIDD